MPRPLHAAFCWFACLLLVSVSESASPDPTSHEELLATNPLAREAWLDEARSILRREFGHEAEAKIAELTDAECIAQATEIKQKEKPAVVADLERQVSRLSEMRELGRQQTPPSSELIENIDRLLAERRSDIETVESSPLPLLEFRELTRRVNEREIAARFLAMEGKWNSRLVEAIETCDRIQFLAGAFEEGSSKGSPLLELNGRGYIDGFLKSVQVIESKEWEACLCGGDFDMVFSQGDTIKAKVSFHHGRSLRWHDGPWIGDAELTDASKTKLRHWIVEVGYPGRRDWERK